MMIEWNKSAELNGMTVDELKHDHSDLYEKHHEDDPDNTHKNSLVI